MYERYLLRLGLTSMDERMIVRPRFHWRTNNFLLSLVTTLQHISYKQQLIETFYPHWIIMRQLFQETWNSNKRLFEVVSVETRPSTRYYEQSSTGILTSLHFFYIFSTYESSLLLTSMVWSTDLPVWILVLFARNVCFISSFYYICHRYSKYKKKRETDRKTCR